MMNQDTPEESMLATFARGQSLHAEPNNVLTRTIPSDMHGRPIAVAAVVGLLAFITTGCADRDSAVHSTLHDHDHALPDHWPADLPDASAKIRERLSWRDHKDHQTDRRELDDLIAWVPEIAADSDLTESQWLPIYTASEALRSSTQKQGWTVEQIQQAKELCQMVDQAASSLPPDYNLMDEPESES